MLGSLADWLQLRLVRTGTSPSQLARRLTVHPSTVTRWLAGDTRPRVATVSQLAELFSEDPGLLYVLAGYPTSVGTPAHLAPEEAELLTYFRRLSSEQRSIVLAAARGGAD
jgi:transcriptional regulator with XRE-family HTH domain